MTAGILLAGTYPWTNSPFDSLLPRTLLPIAHRPLIWYGLSWLHRGGIRDVTVCGNRETRLLRDRLRRHVPEGMHVRYNQDSMPRGAAGSARDAAMQSEADTFVIAEGTAVPGITLPDLLRHHRESGAAVTVVVHPERRGKGHAGLMVPSGIYVFGREAIASVPTHGFCDIKERLIPQLYAAGARVLAYNAATSTPRVLDVATYMAVNEWMVEQLVATGAEDAGYLRSRGGLVHREAFVAPEATLVGAVLIGPGARVLSEAVIVGPASIGREATLARGALVSRSAVWRRSMIGEGAVADRCVVGDDAVIEAGAEMFRDVVTSARQLDSAREWMPEPPVAVGDGAPVTLDLGGRIGRVLFGANWSRSPAAQ